MEGGVGFRIMLSTVGYSPSEVNGAWLHESLVPLYNLEDNLSDDNAVLFFDRWTVVSRIFYHRFGAHLKQEPVL